VIAAFDVPSADSTLTQFAVQLQRVLVNTWSSSRAIAVPAGRDPSDVARAAQTHLIITATVIYSPEGILIEARLADLASGRTRASAPIVVASGESVSQTARRLAIALERLMD
jgi:hypothetical protein